MTTWRASESDRVIAKPRGERSEPRGWSRAKPAGFADAPRGLGGTDADDFTRRPHQCHRRGVVMVITLLALVFLAALVFYVFNLGRGTQSRIETQHAADAAVNAGAGWTARAMNTVAMNNVAMTRQLALVNVLDAMPKTVNFTFKDQQAMLEAVRDQLNRGTGRDAWLEADLRMIEGELAQQVGWLDRVDALLNRSGYDIRNVTFYDPPNSERGQLWRAMAALDEFNQATLETMGPIAQTAAVRAAEVNLPDSDSDEYSVAGMLAPASPQSKWERGEFEDFRGPLTNGLTERARAVADNNELWHKYRGPFDAVFGWRDFVQDLEFADVPGPPVSDGFGSPWSGGSGGRRLIDREIISYRPFGMHSWLVRRFHWLNHSEDGYPRNPNPLGALGPLRYSGFRLHLSAVAGTKLDYLWGDGQTQEVVDPRWVTDFSRARAIQESDPSSIHEIRFIELRYTQRITPIGDAEPVLTNWSIRRRPGIRPPGLETLSAYIWRDDQIEDVADEDIDNDGELEDIRQRRMHYYVFGGANIGEEVPVRNPHNFGDPGELPAPIDFDHDAMKPDDLTRRSHLTFLAVARQPRTAPIWARAFDRDRPQPYQIAMAQAHVFNDHSWDLWTRMWHAQLEPVQGYDQWLTKLERAANVAPGISPLESREAGQMVRHLKSVRDLAPLMMKH